MVAQQQQLNMETPEQRALRLRNEHLRKQLQSSAFGVPLEVGGDDNDSVGSDLSTSTFGSIKSVSELEFTGEIVNVKRSGWCKVCKKIGNSTLLSLRANGKTVPLSGPQVLTKKMHQGEVLIAY